MMIRKSEAFKQSTAKRRAVVVRNKDLALKFSCIDYDKGKNSRPVNISRAELSGCLEHLGLMAHPVLVSVATLEQIEFAAIALCAHRKQPEQ